MKQEIVQDHFTVSLCKLHTLVYIKNVESCLDDVMTEQVSSITGNGVYLA